MPFDTKDINMSEYLISAKAEDFIGRQWLYREVEDAFKDDSIGGVLIIGNPGTGKSAWFSQLICSRTTSSTIHVHILGYHFCRYSDKNTQMAGKFVRNLAEMIARRLPEYGYVVSNSSYIQRSFDVDCVQNHDPVGCFEQIIITPLRNLKHEPVHNWFIIVDGHRSHFSSWPLVRDTLRVRRPCRPVVPKARNVERRMRWKTRRRSGV